MRWYWVLAIVVIAFAWSYKQRLSQQQTPRRGPGVARSTGRGVRQATQFSGTGNASPGSGIVPIQPDLTTTWGITGGAGPGYTGPTYARSNARPSVGR